MTRPLIFTAQEVRAFLSGGKTQFRRIVKVKHLGCGPYVHPAVSRITHRGDGWFGFEASDSIKQQYITTFPFETIRCPFGQPGDRIWVKETWRAQDGMTLHCHNKDEIEYRADGDRPKEPTDSHWRSAVHIPQWASRITLDLLTVRVERVQDISEADAIAEGVELPPCTYLRNCRSNSCPRHGRLDRWQNAYRLAHESINGPGSWERNDWVWVAEVKIA